MRQAGYAPASEGRQHGQPHGLEENARPEIVVSIDQPNARRLITWIRTSASPMPTGTARTPAIPPRSPVSVSTSRQTSRGVSPWARRTPSSRARSS